MQAEPLPKGHARDGKKTAVAMRATVKTEDLESKGSSGGNFDATWLRDGSGRSVQLTALPSDTGKSSKQAGNQASRQAGKVARWHSHLLP